LARALSRSTGFSQKIALSARAAASMRSACVSVELAMATASIEESAKMVSASATCAPVSLARASAALPTGSAT
jgi:hypothetical protein